MIEGLLLTRHFIVDCPAAMRVDVRAAELFLLDFSTKGSIHDGWPRNEKLTGPAHHY